MPIFTFIDLKTDKIGARKYPFRNTFFALNLMLFVVSLYGISLYGN